MRRIAEIKEIVNRRAKEYGEEEQLLYETK